MKQFITIVDGINKWVGFVVSVLILILTGIVMFEIVMRYVFGMPTVWVHEAGMYLFGAMWCLGGGYTLLGRGMVKMDVIYLRFSTRGRAIIDICTFVLSFIVVAVLLWKSGITAWSSLLRFERSGTAWDPPYYPVRLALPLGALLLLIQLISQLIKDIIIATGKGIDER